MSHILQNDDVIDADNNGVKRATATLECSFQDFQASEKREITYLQTEWKKKRSQDAFFLREVKTNNFAHFKVYLIDNKISNSLKTNFIS